MAVPAIPLDGGDTKTTVLDDALRRRAELYDTAQALVRALEVPSPGREDVWLDRVNGHLQLLRAEIEEHVETTEGPDGIHAEIVLAQPRLANKVRRLAADHEILRDRINAVAALSARSVEQHDRAMVMAVRDESTLVVGLLVRHRQRSSDLVYEAYQTDIGGDD
jgi:hypothetical protein